MLASQRVTSLSASQWTNCGRSPSSTGRKRTLSPSRMDSDITVELCYHALRGAAGDPAVISERAEVTHGDTR